MRIRYITTVLEKQSLLFWVTLGAALFFSTIVFMYGDLTNTIDNANILLRAVIQGRVLDFYELSVEKSVTNFAAN